MRQLLAALDLGYDAAYEVATDYHLAMAGYRPQEHQRLDNEVKQIQAAIDALYIEINAAAEAEEVGCDARAM